MQKVARQLGRYHVMDRIAYGGMAEIFRALTFEESGKGLLVAIKQVLPHYAEDQEFIDMLVDEASLVSMLHHPNIVEIYEVGHVDEFYFIAMEFVWGKDLRSVLERCRNLGTQIPYEVSAYLLAEALAGLDTAHRLLDHRGMPASLVHRDFSPSNILVSYNGDVKICDFGIAKANFSRTETKTGVIKGKVKYMSPEQAFGRKLDHRSDLFSAGSVFYEMLTGKPPFLAGNEIDLIFMVRDAQIKPPSQIIAQVPNDLEKIIYRSMARSRSRRYQSAAEFRFSLLTYLRNRGAGNWKAELARFMRALYAKELACERANLNEYVLGYEQAGAPDLGRNLIADVLGRDAAYTKFNPYPTQAQPSPNQAGEVHDASTRIIDPAALEDIETIIKESPVKLEDVAEQATRILDVPETPPEPRSGNGAGQRVFDRDTSPNQMPGASSSPPPPGNNPGGPRRSNPPPHPPAVSSRPAMASPPGPAVAAGRQPPVATPPANPANAKAAPRPLRPTLRTTPPVASTPSGRSDHSPAPPNPARPPAPPARGGPSPSVPPPLPAKSASSAPAARSPQPPQPRRPPVKSVVTGPPPPAPPPNGPIPGAAGSPRRTLAAASAPPLNPGPGAYSPPAPSRFGGELEDSEISTLDYTGQDDGEERTKIAGGGRGDDFEEIPTRIAQGSDEDDDEEEKTMAVDRGERSTLPEPLNASNRRR